MTVRFGIDRALAEPALLPGRVGLVTNGAARPALDPAQPSRQALQRAGCRLVRLFSPEHGLATEQADGHAVSDAVDPMTGLPVVSLYGDRMRPAAGHLAELDAVAFDIPDIGARFYTYIWTLSHVLEACAAANKPLVVLDRPNPLGGGLADCEGPMLDVARCGSFLGRAAIPIRHSLTAGEFAWLLNQEWQLGVDVRVVTCSGWRRAMHWPDTGLPFVPTSPAMRCYEAALLYPGLCLFEATNVSVGRGSDQPFQQIGAPWLAARELAARLNRVVRDGVEAEAGEFVPALPPYAGEICQALRLRVLDAKRVRPVALGLRLLGMVIELQRGHFRWAQYPTAANPTGADHFERLIGVRGIREVLEESPAQVGERLEEWTACAGWQERVRGVLRYE